MRFAISIPQFYADAEFAPEDFRSYFARAESLGCYQSAWAQEMTLSASPQLAPVEAMTYAAACNGFFGAGSSTLAAFESQVRTVRAELAAAGRSAREFPIAKRLYVAIDSDAARARSRMNAALRALYGRRVPSITVADCVAAVRAAGAAGAELILFTPLFEVGEHMEQVAAEVIPRLGVR
jgi:hypothetical protein